MYLSALAALDRKNCKLVILASVAHPAAGRDSAKVAAAYNDLIAGTPAGAAKRAKYSHVVFMIDNQVRNQHQFPDPVALAEKQTALEKQTAEAQLREAQSRLDIATKAKDAADAQHAAAQAHASSLGVITEPAKPAQTVVSPPPQTKVPDFGALRAEAERLHGIASAASAAATAAKGKPEEEALIMAAIEADTAYNTAQDALVAAGPEFPAE